MENNESKALVYKKLRETDIILLYIAIVAFMILTVFVPTTHESTLFISSTLITVLSTAVCINDAKLRGKPLIGSYKMMLILTSVFGLAMYIVYTRKKRAFLLISKHILLLAAILSFAAILAQMIISIFS